MNWDTDKPGNYEELSKAQLLEVCKLIKGFFKELDDKLENIEKERTSWRLSVDSRLKSIEDYLLVHKEHAKFWAGGIAFCVAYSKNIFNVIKGVISQ